VFLQKHDQLQKSLLDYVKAAEDQEKTISHLKDRIDQLTVHADLEVLFFTLNLYVFGLYNYI